MLHDSPDTNTLREYSPAPHALNERIANIKRSGTTTLSFPRTWISNSGAATVLSVFVKFIGKK